MAESRRVGSRRGAGFVAVPTQMAPDDTTVGSRPVGGGTPRPTGPGDG